MPRPSFSPKRVEFPFDAMVMESIMYNPHQFRGFLQLIIPSELENQIQMDLFLNSLSLQSPSAFPRVSISIYSMTLLEGCPPKNIPLVDEDVHHETKVIS